MYLQTQLNRMLEEPEIQAELGKAVQHMKFQTQMNRMLKSYVHKEPRPRSYGRYHASELSSIAGGWKKPEDFFKPADIQLKGCRMILVGQAMEEKLTDIFRHNNVECIAQAKKVLEFTVKHSPSKIERIQLVVKPDFLFDDFLIETKFTFSTGDLIERYKYQLEAEYRAFNRQVYLGILSSPFNLELIKYEQSDSLWEEIKRMLISYHKEVEKPKVTNNK